MQFSFLCGINNKVTLNKELKVQCHKTNDLLEMMTFLFINKEHIFRYPFYMEFFKQENELKYVL